MKKTIQKLKEEDQHGIELMKKKEEVTIHAPNNACTTNNPYRIHYAISCLSLSSFFFIFLSAIYYVHVHR